jgi:hypothetical protein
LCVVSSTTWHKSVDEDCNKGDQRQIYEKLPELDSKETTRMFIEFLYSNERHTYLSHMGVRDGTGQQVLREEFTVAITINQ